MKEWTATVYETNTFNSLLKDALHPGGLAMTQKLTRDASLNNNSIVLDIACGQGGTSIFLAQKFGCRVIGIDLSPKTISLARSKKQATTTSSNIELIVADAEELPFMEAVFDTIISECSFSILANKEKAASEMNRVLKTNGKLIISDITLKEGVANSQQDGPNPAQDDRPLVPCLAGTRSIEDYLVTFDHAGFENTNIEDHSAALGKIGYQLATNFGGWEGFLRNLSAELLPDSESRETAEKKACRIMSAPRKFGYTLLMFNKR